MRVGDHYDLIIIGNQLSGYFLATAAAQRGHRVLVIEEQAYRSVLFERPSGTFLTDLHWEPWIGLKDGTEEDQFLRDIGLYQNVDELLPQFSPAVQMISDQGRVDFSYPFHRMREEWVREYPKSAEQLHRLGSRLHADHTSTGRKLASLVEQIGLEPHWTQVGDIQAALYGAVSPEHISLGLVKSFLEYAEAGVRYPLGGRDAAKEILRARLKWHGGRVKTDARVEEIILERGKLAGVLLSSFEGFVRCDRLAGNMSGSVFLHLLPEEYRPETLQRRVEAMRARYWRLNFTLKLPESAVPEGMAKHVCYHNLDRELGEGQFLQVFALPRSCYSGIEPGCQVLLVRCLLPTEPRALRPEYISVTIKRCLKQLQSFIPFVDEKISVVPNPDNIQADPIFQEHYQFDSFEDIPHDLLVYAETWDSMCRKAIPWNWSRYGLSNISLCSRDVLPALGVLGEIQTARRVLRSFFGSKAVRENTTRH